MTRMTDQELEGLLRRCGDELRLRSEEHSRGAGASAKESTLRRAATAAADWELSRRRTLGELVRDWLVPAELGLACVLLLAVVFSLNRRPGEIPIAPAPSEDYEYSEAELMTAEVDEAYENFYPEYEALVLDTADLTTEETDDEDEYEELYDS